MKNHIAIISNITFLFITLLKKPQFALRLSVYRFKVPDHGTSYLLVGHGFNVYKVHLLCWLKSQALCPAKVQSASCGIIVEVVLALRVFYPHLDTDQFNIISSIDIRFGICENSAVLWAGLPWEPWGTYIAAWNSLLLYDLIQFQCRHSLGSTPSLRPSTAPRKTILR